LGSGTCADAKAVIAPARGGRKNRKCEIPKACRINSGRTASDTVRPLRTGQIYRTGTVPHAIKPKSTLILKAT